MLCAGEHDESAAPADVDAAGTPAADDADGATAAGETVPLPSSIEPPPERTATSKATAITAVTTTPATEARIAVRREDAPPPFACPGAAPQYGCG
jgi:hypothetical protein